MRKHGLLSVSKFDSPVQDTIIYIRVEKHSFTYEVGQVKLPKCSNRTMPGVDH